MKKRLRISLVFISLVLVLSSCVSTSTNNDDKNDQKDSKFIRTGYVRDGVEISKEEMLNNLGYYEDIHTAIENTSIDGIVELKEVLKTVENDEKVIVYGVIAYKKGYELLTIMPLLKKIDEETGKLLYSEPLTSISQSYESYGKFPMNAKSYKHFHFALFNYSKREDITIPEKKNFQYFLLETRERAEKIRINGHKPDEIIEHDAVDRDLNKHKTYFVYFNDVGMMREYHDAVITFD